MRGCAADTSVRHVDYARLRPLSYPQTDYVIIMYSVADRTSFEHAIGMWSDEIEKHLPNVGRLYLGLKTDLRDKLSDSVPAKSAMVNLTELAAPAIRVHDRVTREYDRGTAAGSRVSLARASVWSESLRQEEVPHLMIDRSRATHENSHSNTCT